MTEYQVVPHPKLKRDYRGRKVRTLSQFSNGWGVIPLGTVATITSQGPKGSTLTCEPCGCCGLRATIGGIRPEDIQFIESIN